MIYETCERADDGTWHYRDPRMQRVVDALVRAELIQCAHRNRPLRHDGRVVVMRLGRRDPRIACDDRDHQLTQLTPEGMPLALARRAAEDIRLARAAAKLEARGEVVTSRALAEAAHISREYRLCLAPHTENRRDGTDAAVINFAIELLLHF